VVDYRIDVVVNPQGAVAGTRTVEKRLRGVEGQANRVGASLRRAFAFVGAGALLVGAVRSLAEFEERMATVRAVTGATAEEFQLLRDRAVELGTTTRFTANQAAGALLSLSRAGFEVEEALQAVGGTLLLAQSGGLDLASATDIAAAALRGFRLEATQTERVVDVLTLTANSANTTVGQLGEALKFVAPVAAGLNQSIEGTSAALATLSDAGLKATLAGTGLRRVLAELEAPSSNTQKILRELGVTTENIRVSQVGLVAALQELADAGVDTGQALEIFGQRGGPAFEVLVNNIPRIRQLNEALENSQGVARATADEIDRSLRGALFRVQSAFDGLTKSLGEAGATSALTQSFEATAVAVRALAANANALLDTLVQLGGAFLAVKILEFAQSTGVAVKSQLQLQAAVSRGNAVIIGSAEAQRQQALATVEATQAELANTQATIANTQAKIAQQNALLGVGQSRANLALQQSQLTALQAQATAQSDALAVAQGRLATATKASAATATIAGRAWNALKTTVAGTGTVFVVAAGTFFAVNKILEYQKKLIGEIGEAMKAIEDAGSMNKIGAGITNARQELASLNKIQQQQGFLTESQQLRADALRKALDGYANAAKKASQDGLALANAQKALDVSFDSTIGRLDRQIKSLQAFTRESKVAIQVEEEVQKLLQGGTVPTAAQRSEIQQRLEKIVALKNEKKALEDIRGPQEAYRQQVLTLSSLFRQGRITQEEFTGALNKLRSAFAEDTAANPFESQTQALENQVQLTRTLVEEGERAAEVLQLRQQIESQGVSLTDTQLAQLDALVGKQQALNDKLKQRREEERAAQQEADALNRLQEQLDYGARLNEQKEQLNELLRLRPDLEDAIIQKVRDLEIASLQSSTAFGDGFTRAFLKIQKEADNLAAVGEKVVGVFANQAIDAITEFTETGRFSFKKFASAILDDLKRILIRLLVIQTISAIVPGGAAASIGAGAAGAAGGARAEGGPLAPNRQYLVGERGPELVDTGSTSGNVTSNSQLMEALGGKRELNLQVINVDNPDMVPQAISDGRSDEAIINVLARNKDRVNQVTQ
jgi:TP901 family phage tail tape measure protein